MANGASSNCGWWWSPRGVERRAQSTPKSRIPAEAPLARDQPEDGGHLYNATKLYAAFGVSHARFHDGDLNICAIYTDDVLYDMNDGGSILTTCTNTSTGAPPHVRWAVKDAGGIDNPANYDFAALDDAIRATLDAGAALYLRLGENYNGPNDTTDPVSWARVATNIYRHVIGAFKPSAGVNVDPRFVEVHNEPDGMFWVGDKATFYMLFNETVDRVRAAALDAGRSVKVGGAGFTEGIVSNITSGSSLAGGFIAAVDAGRLDFYSAHDYNDCAAATIANSVNWFTTLRAQIDARGLAAKPLHITEWNIGLGQSCGYAFFENLQVQSYTSGILTVMQEPALNVEAAQYYAGTPPMSFFEIVASRVGSIRVNPGAWAEWAHAQLRGGTRVATASCSAAVCASGLDAGTLPLLALAARVDAGLYRAVVTNDTAAARSFALRVRGLSPGMVQLKVSTPPDASVDVACGLAGGRYEPTASEMTTLMGRVATATQSLPVSDGGIEATVSIGARSIRLIEVVAQ